MPYQLECQFCNHRVEVTEPAAPAPAQCPECASFHTFAPVTKRPPVSVFSVLRSFAPPPDGGPPTPAAPRPTLPADCTPPARITGWHPELVVGPVAAPPTPPVGVLAESPAPAPAAAPAPKPVPRTATLEVRPPPARVRAAAAAPPRPTRIVHPDAGAPSERPEAPFLLAAAGPAALLLAGAAVACVAWPLLQWLAAPLCVIGLLAGLAGAAAKDGTSRSRLIPAAGAAACGAVLLAVTVPDVGLAFRSGRMPGPAALRVVPLRGDRLDSEADDGGWIDASRAAVQKSRVGVQVTHVTLAAPADTHPAAATHAAAPKRRLLVRMLFQRIWGGEPTPGETADATPPAVEPRVTLTDDAGKTYAPLPSDEPGPPRKLGGFGEQVYAFDAPAPGRQFLRLELPAAPWGGTGSIRFKIPAAMIRAEAAKPARPAAVVRGTGSDGSPTRSPGTAPSYSRPK
jgi:hypothetical protein